LPLGRSRNIAGQDCAARPEALGTEALEAWRARRYAAGAEAPLVSHLLDEVLAAALEPALLDGALLDRLAAAPPPPA